MQVSIKWSANGNLSRPPSIRVRQIDVSTEQVNISVVSDFFVNIEPRK